MTKFVSLLLASLLLALLVHGCVNPGDVDVNDMQRLQQAMLARSPQDRPREGLGLMRPTTPDILSLTVEKGPDGRSIITLGLQQAVMIALAGNTDIAVVSYSPQISREQMVEAAAEFDYTMFGSYQYTSTDTALAHRGGTIPGVQKDHVTEFGIRQRTITGADWQVSNSFSRTWDDATTDSANRWYQQNLSLSVSQPLLRGAWPEYNLSALKIARLNHKITMSQFRSQVEETATAVMAAYYQLIQARRNVEIVEALLVITRKTHKQVVGRSQIDATKVQITQALAAVYNREAVLIEVKKIQNDAQDRLVRLLGASQINLLHDFELIPATQITCLPVEINVADQLLTALRLSPLLEQARYSITQAEINVRLAENELLPLLNFTLGLTANGGSTGSRTSVRNDVTSGEFVSYQAGLEFEYPIGNRAAESRLSQNRLQKLQQITQMQNTADQIAEAIRERIRQIQSRQEEYQIQLKNLGAAKGKLQALNDLEEIRGKLTPEFLDLKLTTQAQVASAEQSVIQAVVLYNTGMLDLARLTGSVLEMNQIKLALPVVTTPGEVLLDAVRPVIDQPEPDVQPTTQPAVKPTPQPAIEPAIQPVWKMESEPVWEPAIQPAMQPVWKLDVEPEIANQ